MSVHSGFYDSRWRWCHHLQSELCDVCKSRAPSPSQTSTISRTTLSFYTRNALPVNQPTIWTTDRPTNSVKGNTM